MELNRNIDRQPDQTYNPSMSSTLKFIGLNTPYPTADGNFVARLHMDGAASPLAAESGLTMVQRLLPHYSNTHSYVHSSAQISSKALAWAHKTVLEFLGADHQEYAAIFSGSGSTAAINRVARGLSAARPNRKVVLVSSMEHHANDLPHRQFDNQVIYLPLTGEGAHSGAVDLERLSQICAEHTDDVNYIAVSSVSNVTGVRNPIKEICEIAHQNDLLVLVDGAQSVAHGPSELSNLDVDFFVFSGHKTYTPMSPGVLVAKKSLLQGLKGQDLGGGSVASVSPFDYQFVDDPSEREESGTPNIIGAVALAAVLKELMDFGLDNIKQHDDRLMASLKSALSALPYITVYADHTLERTGALAFNIEGLDHGLAAAILNDYFAIALRNECFCAHPYVSSLLKEELWQLNLSRVQESEQEAFINRKRGMVRASISLYNTEADIQRLVTALKELSGNIEQYTNNYRANPDGSYFHTAFNLDWESQLYM